MRGLLISGWLVDWLTEAAIKASNEHLPAATTMVIMDPYQAEAFLRFTAIVSYKELSSEGDTLIHTTASLNFAGKEFVVANGFYRDCKTVLKLSIRVASE